MGRLLVNEFLGFTDDIRPARRSQERLLGLRAEVNPDGDSTCFSVQFSNMPAFNVLVPLEEIAPIQHEIRSAANLMVERQRFKVDYGHEKLLELCSTALRPVDVEVLIEPHTGDRMFILQFRDHSPMVLRQSPAQVAVALQRLADAVGRSLN